MISLFYFIFDSKITDVGGIQSVKSCGQSLSPLPKAVQPVKVLTVWATVSQKGMSDLAIKQAMNQKVYIECLQLV